MRSRFLASLLLSFSVAAVVVPSAHAAPGEAAAVISACGAPASDEYGKSDVSGLPLRTLTYGNLRLKFEPVDASATEANWQFTSGWSGHLPQTANEIAKAMPCFGQGLQAAQQAASGQQLAADPSISAQQLAPVKRAPFGIANLWLILFLGGVIAIFAVAIPRKRRLVNGPSVKQRQFRRPQLGMIRFRRRPKTALVNRL